MGNKAFRPSMWTVLTTAAGIVMLSHLIVALAVADPRAQPSANDLCSKIVQIKVLPFNADDPTQFGIDQVYAEFRRAGKEAIPCLLENLTNLRRMRDPRQAPVHEPVVVGDVAFFVLCDITNCPLEGLLPPSVQRRAKTVGIYAYFEWVEHGKDSRRQLQRNVRKWLGSKGFLK